MWRNWDFCELLAGMESGNDSTEVPQKLKQNYPMTQQFHSWVHPEELSKNSQGYLYTHVHGSIIQ